MTTLLRRMARIQGLPKGARLALPKWLAWRITADSAEKLTQERQRLIGTWFATYLLESRQVPRENRSRTQSLLVLGVLPFDRS